MDQALRDKMCARMREVQTQVAERDELIEVIAIALLTRKNVFVLGDTGQAKSAVINLFRDGLTGARQFERLMSKQADEEALFGRLDLSSLIPGGVPEEILEEDALYQEMRRDLETLVLNYRRGDASFGQQLELATTELERYRKALSELHGGEPRIITKGKLPDSHIVFLDEIFKASDGILNALLTALNERRYADEGRQVFRASEGADGRETEKRLCLRSRREVHPGAWRGSEPCAGFRICSPGPSGNHTLVSAEAPEKGPQAVPAPGGHTQRQRRYNLYAG